MKTTINHTPKTDKIQYPLLMSLIANKLIVVYFTAPKTGTVVVQHPDWNFGTHSTTWVDEHLWTPFNGEITISNN